MYASVTVLVRSGVRIVPSTPLEIADDLPFEQLFSKIKAGCFEQITEELTLSVVKEAFVGLSRDNLSTVHEYNCFCCWCMFGFQLVFKIRSKLKCVPLQAFPPHSTPMHL